jgi:hypothetical protein
MTTKSAALLGQVVTVKTESREVLEHVVGGVFVDVMDLNPLAGDTADAAGPVRTEQDLRGKLGRDRFACHDGGS